MNPNRMNRPQVVACPAPEEITERHVHNVLDILLGLQPYLLPVEAVIGATTPRLDGEASVAATTTFIKCCTRLDTLLADETRWTLAPHKELYESLKANYDQQYQFLKSQTNASNALSRPFFLLKPDLVKTPDGEFVAYWGKVTTPGMGLLGRGKTPAEAFADFDQAFFRNQQHVLENAEAKKKTRKKK